MIIKSLFGDLESKTKENWGMGRPKGGFPESSMKEDEYSLNEIRLLGFKGDRWSVPLQFTSPSWRAEGFLTVFDPQQNCHGMGRCNFYYGNGFWSIVPPCRK